MDDDEQQDVDGGADLTAFVHARDRLRVDYSARGAGKSLNPLFSPATLARLFKSEVDYPSNEFSPAIRERLIWLFNTERQTGAYHFIEELMGHTEIGRSIIFRDFVGDYCLFRFAAANILGSGGSGPADHTSLRFVEEKVRIFKDLIDEPAYEYETHETPNDGIVIKGAVFYALGHLFMPGLSCDTMSLAIVSAARATGSMHGFWNSVGKRGAGSPYSARFLMVDSRNEAVLNRLRGPNGENAFFEITGGNYAYYMSI